MTHADVIADMNKVDFEAELNESLGGLDFQPFLDERVLSRTLDFLLELRDTVDGQLVRNAETAEPEWLSRAKGFRSLVESRLKLVRRHIGAAEKRQRDSVTAAVREWKDFAHELCKALDESDNEVALDTIMAPYELSAGDWFDARLRKRGLLDDESVAA